MKLHGLLPRWTASFALLSVPKAAGPIAFSLLAIPLTGDPTSGAAIMMAMTLAQLLGAVPVVRLGQGRNTVAFFKLLLAFRSLALVAMVSLAVTGAPFAWLIVAAAAAGLVDGAAFSFLRSILRHLVDSGQVVRALAIGSTLNEVTFVAAPVLASVLSAISPALAVVVAIVLGALPLLLIPSIADARISDPAPNALPGGRRSTYAWLVGSCASGAAVGAIEVGAVAIAIDLGYDPHAAVLFTVALCLASVSGGTWISIRNRMIGLGSASAFVLAMTIGSALVAWRFSVATTLIGCVLVGLVLAPLSTFYSITVENLAPPDRRAEAFALLRTANTLGLVFASAALAWSSLEYGLYLGTGFSVVALVALLIKMRLASEVVAAR